MPIDEQRKHEVLHALAAVRPYIQGDGGDVDLVDIAGGVVTVRLTGACTSCSSSSTTVNAVIRQHLHERLGWVTDVRAENSAAPTAGEADPPLPKATAALEGAHHAAASHMDGLQRAIIVFQAGQDLPAAFARWGEFARGNLRRHFELEEGVLFPVSESMLPSASQSVAAMRREHARFFELQAALEDACGEYQRVRDAKAASRVMVCAHDALKHLEAHFAKEEGALFAVIEENLPEDMKANVRNGLQNALRGQLNDWS